MADAPAGPIPDTQISGTRVPQVPIPPVSNQDRFKTEEEVHDIFLQRIKAEGNQWANDPDPQRAAPEPAADEAAEAKGEEPAPKAEDAKEEGDVITLDPDAELFEMELSVDGKKEAKKLSLKELQHGYLRQADYQRKTAEVARAREEAEANVRGQVQQAQAAYQQQLAVTRQALIRAAAPELQNVDWNKLSTDDPAEFVRLSAKANNLQASLNAIDGELRQAAAFQQQQQQAALAATVQESLKVLQQDIPEWSDDKYRELLKGAVEDYTFKPEEIGAVYDARVIKLLHDALQWRQLQKAKPATEKKLVTVPKTLKPGTENQARNPAQTKLQEADTRLRKSGKPEDFAALLLARGSHKF